MNAQNRVKFAAMLQREIPQLFQKLFESYAAEHSRGRAQYMKDNLQFWDNGKVAIQPESLNRFSAVRFPDTTASERNWLICHYVEDGTSLRMRSFEIDLRIESGLDGSAERLRSIVRNFLERPYNVEVATHFYDGMLWVLDGEATGFWNAVDPYIRAQGEAAFKEVSGRIEAYIYLMQRNAVPIPFRKSIPYPGGRIGIDFNHTVGKRMVERLKFWRAKPIPPAIAPESERKFTCPNPDCSRVMLLTPDEVRANAFACPWCWKYGSVTSPLTSK